MKKFYIALSLFLASFAYSQVPQAFSYQTIAFNSAGAPIANGNVNLRISILDNSATGTVLYTETHTKTTNSKGLVNLNIGQGTATTGNFGGINWGTNSKFVKVEMDPAGGSNYTNVGVNQLMSVPYALVADKVNLNSNGTSLNDDIVENKFSNFAFYSNSTGNVYVFNQKTGNWVSQSNGSSTIIASNGNFAFYSNSNGNVYVFNKNTGTWIPQSNGSSTIIESNGNFAFYSNSTGNVYVFNQKIGTWVSQSNGSSTIIASNGNFAFYSSSNGNVYVFNQNTGTWISQSNGSSAITASNGSFVFYSSSSGNVYAFNKNTGTWVSQNNGSSTIQISETN
ncbi:outer membrane protein assembly factor BamB [Epilithonimonas hungarica]|uniref:outer membrane protein assembly factor BamB family protein n=1 Tax=Epilithonimonas hungarica TaxID=454006 RepID=UPI00278BA9FB|nr:PQQ-binding-like beta-propeller repeat protein [Epilithonimonas hungarica]MDP9955682.1 outer membrane protein assembly factor BamB [Epilithonimonas hungarica]